MYMARVFIGAYARFAQHTIVRLLVFSAPENDVDRPVDGPH